MADWNGIPREQVPWFPTIHEEKCTGCMTCVEFCSHSTYQKDEATGKAKVSNPFNCVVGCSNCSHQCPVEAIVFPPLSVLSDYIKK